jgi:hypothetical protein
MIRRGGKVTSLGKAVNEALRGLGLYKKYQQHRVWEVWDRVVGPRISSVAQPDALDFDTLFVAVSDSMWLQQLNSLQNQFLDNLNGALGRKVISRIYFRLGETRRIESTRSEASSRPHLLQVDPADREAIEDSLRDMSDEESRALLRNILMKSAALAKRSVKDNEI